MVAALLRAPASVVGVVALSLVALGVSLGPVLYGVDPMEAVARPLAPIGSPGLPLGSDELGRDLLAGILNGGRVTLLVGVLSAALSTILGVGLGAAAGFYGGAIDAVLMWLTEFFQVLPALLFAMAIVVIFEPSMLTLVLAIGLVVWPAIARVTRGEFLRLREQEFVRAAKSAGAGDLHVIFRVILPNALPPIVVMATLIIGTAMLFEAGLSFLGLNDPNQVTWGGILGSNRDKLALAWWPATLPGLAILVTVLSVSLVGDGLNDAANPRRRSR